MSGEWQHHDVDERMQTRKPPDIGFSTTPFQQNGNAKADEPLFKFTESMVDYLCRTDYVGKKLEQANTVYHLVCLSTSYKI